MTTWTSTDHGMPVPFGITDAELWELVGTVRTRHQHKPQTGACKFCGEVWPCGAERLAILADTASRMPTTRMAGAEPAGAEPPATRIPVTRVPSVQLSATRLPADGMRAGDLRDAVD